MRIEGDGVSLFFCWEEWRTGLITINALFLCGYVLINSIKQKSHSRGKACHFYTSKIDDSEVAANGLDTWPAYLLDIFCLFVSYLFEVIKPMTNTAPVLAQTVIDKYIEDLPELPNKSYTCR